jgi:hypothetical protein
MTGPRAAMWLGARRFNPFIPTHKWEGHIYYYIPFSLFLCVCGGY